jgi:hypothetical protein
MLTKESIEERVWETLRLKKSLFAGVFDSPTGEVSFEKLGRKSVLQAVKEIFADQPARPKPIVSPPAPEPVPVVPPAAGTPESSPSAPPAPAMPVELAAASLVEAGLQFFESLALGSEGGASAGIASLLKRDAQTTKPVLSVPLPESITEERLTTAISGLVKMFFRSASAAAAGSGD